MNSKPMDGMNMSPEDFVLSGNIRHKAMIIEDLIEDGLDFLPRIGDWVAKVLVLEVEKENGLSAAPVLGPHAEYLIRIVKAVAKDVHRQDVREMLGRLYQDSIERSGLHYALEGCMIAGIDDELDDVRQWALANLQAKGRIDPSTDMQAFLVDILAGDEIPYYLKQDTALVLGATGTEKAKIALAHLAAKLILDPGKSPYDQIVNNALKESVAQGLGLTGDEGVVRRLTALQIFCDDMEVKNAARNAIKRIRMAAEKNRRSSEPEQKASALCPSETSRRYMIAASDFKKSGIIMALDETGSYEFELDVEQAPARIFLHSTTESSVPRQLRITLITNLEDTPEIACTLQRRKDDLEMYGYLDVKLATDSVKRITVDSH
ncbi:hypothetical protein [Desulfosarcina ovata]|uniref:Uncharacterized protein n=1 Tax=Desulfosarcina ovata subsp. ovata TaxID=2752305 RepID=A0A5K8A6V3_9BACT|nr:hypothetical protein [Desulfosarcina ovata]BBO87880.1 hypothetical protein DSCOOX_10600 [Desulfosarcina ovata subsp. ovata]